MGYYRKTSINSLVTFKISIVGSQYEVIWKETVMEEKKIEENFQVFFCYNHEDEFGVKKIGNELQLKEPRILPWFYKDIRPGTLRQREIDQQVEHVSVAVVFIGKAGVSREQELEIYSLMGEFARRDCRVIPVLLEDAPDKPELSNSLKRLEWVDFRTKIQSHNLLPEDDPLNRLLWGITGQRAWRKQQHILIASLGESPVVVSSMYDLLTKRKEIKIEIDQVIVLQPNDKDIERGYELIEKAFADKCKLRDELLPFKDASSWKDASLFLKELYTLLDTCQIRGDIVYLSLAGGRKSMAALMAWIVPFFSCVKNLYHVIDPDEEHFLSISELDLDLTPSERELAMHPDIDPLLLVDIPFKRGLQIDQELIARLLSSSTKELEKMQDEGAKRALEAEQAEFVQDIFQIGTVLEAMITERMMEQFGTLYQQDRDTARRVRAFLDRMQFTSELRNLQPDSLRYKLPKPAKRTSIELHSFVVPRTSVQLVFYTLPNDIYNSLDNEVEQVVICELETGEQDQYRSLQEIAASPDFSTQKAHHLEELPRVPPTTSVDSVLIVPLGAFPMVATQLYTLLKYQEGRNIREVILVYPARFTKIVNGADLIERSLQEEANVPCIHAPVADLKDIDSSEACQLYQAILEDVIDQARKDHPNYTIDLALSGGRKGMTAMTIFAAQNKQLPYVYHTLISDEKLSDVIDEQTTVEVLNDLSLEERNDLLFLRTFEGNGPYTRFVLFKVPVFPAGRQQSA